MSTFVFRLIAISLLFAFSPLWAQISVGELGKGDVNTAQNNNSLTFSVRAGSNRVLLVAVETIGNPSAVTFNGMNLTEIGGVDAGAGIRGELWGIALGSGIQIDSTISVTGMNTTNSWNVVGAQAFSNVHQTVPWDGFTGATTGGGNSSTSIMVNSKAGDHVFDAMVAQGTNPMTANVGDGQFESFNENTGNGLGAGSYEQSSAPANMSWDFTNFLAGAHMGINLKSVNPPTADIALTFMESTDPVQAGSGNNNLVHTITATNNGPNAVTGLKVSSTSIVPLGVGAFAITPSAGTSFLAPVWTIGSLASGASATLSWTYTALAFAPVGTNTIQTSANVTASNFADPVAGNDTTSVLTSVARDVDITVSKAESRDPVAAGSGSGNLTHVITAVNNGLSNVSFLTIDEVLTLPAGVTVDSITPSIGSYVDPTWTLNLAAGAIATLTIVMTVGPSAVPGTDVISDTASVSGSGGGESFFFTHDDSATEGTSIVALVELIHEDGFESQ